MTSFINNVVVHWRILYKVALIVGTGMSLIACSMTPTKKTLTPNDLTSELNQAQALLAKKDYSAAYQAYQIHAEQGNALAQFNMALFHQNGWGRQVDPVQACQWYEKAAQGDIPAAYQFYGDCLKQGIHRPADSVAAIKAYESAVRLGLFDSLCSIGRLYIKGQGVTKDVAKGLALCQQAAEQGSLGAALLLAETFYQGTEIKPDYKQALHWYAGLAERKVAKAQFRLAQMLHQGLGINKNNQAARFWYESAAEQGYLEAYLPTAELYFYAEENPKNDKPLPAYTAKAYLWLTALLKRADNKKIDLKVANELHKKVLNIMPDQWHVELDKKVAEHLKSIQL